MKCKLCIQERELCCSHIIPEFMYKCIGMYDEKGRFVIIREIKGKAEYKQRQKGLKERLLCKECETKMSKWEQYARRILYGPGTPKKPTKKPERILVFEGVNYKTFKLFLLSILWRMSISGLEEFIQVRLGPHTETIRKMLLEGNPGNEDDYGCFVTSVIFDSDDFEINENLRKFMLHPEPFRAQGHNCYRVFIGGLVYCFVISKHNVPTKIRELFLNRLDQLPVLVRGTNEVPFVSNGLRDFYPHLKAWGRKLRPSQP